MQFRILGPLEVDDGVVVARLSALGQRALLSILLLRANEVVSTDRLIDELWGDEPPASGATALQVRVSQLRKTLGGAAERLETRAPGYVLRVQRDELDLDLFSRLVEESDGAEPDVAARRLREALALWRGAALADVAYEPFAQAAILRLGELRLTALERRIEADLALGRHAELVGELESLVAEHPLRERLRGQLMLALYRSDRQAEALTAYRETRRALVDQLGIEPSSALQSLEQAVLRHDPALELTAQPIPERSILVAPLRDDTMDSLLAIGEPLARRPPKELILSRLVQGPDQLAPATAGLQEHRSALLSRGIPTRIAALVSRSPANDIVRIAVEQDVDLVLVDGSADLLRDPTLERLLATAPCDVAILVPGDARPGPVLVPFVGAEHDWAAIELAAWLAGTLGVSLLLAGPCEARGRRDASHLLADASLAIQRTSGVAAEPLLLEPGAAALVKAAEDAGLVIVGLSDRWRKDGLGTVRETVAAAAGPPVVLVRHGLRPGGLATGKNLTRFTWSLKG